MCAAYGNGRFVILHHLPQKLCPGQHGKIHSSGGDQFRIIRFDGCSIDDQVNVWGDVFLALSIVDAGALRRQDMSQVRRRSVGAGDLKLFCQKDFCESAHTDAADTNKVYVNWILEIDLVHGYLPIYIFY